MTMGTVRRSILWVLKHKLPSLLMMKDETRELTRYERLFVCYDPF